MKLRQLRSFVAVAEARNFTRAAEQMNLAQPSLSRHIQLLEDDLGVQLVRRDRQTVELTGAGEQFLGTARRTLAALETGVQALKEPADALRTLRVAFPEYANYGHTPRFLGAFQERFPEVRLERLELSTGPLLEALQEERVDVGFVLAPEPHDLLEAEPVERQALALVLPEDHALAARSHVSFKLLAGEPLLLYQRELSPGFFDMVRRCCERAGFTPVLNIPSTRHAYSLSTMLRMVAAGEGLHPLLASKVEYLQNAPAPNNPMTGLVARPFLEPYAHLSFSAVWRKTDEHTGKRTGKHEVLRQFLRVVRKQKDKLAAPSSLD